MPRRYTVKFSQASVSAVQDLVFIKAPASMIVRVLEVRISQSSSTASAQLRARHNRMTGTITNGSGGASATPAKHETGDNASSVTARVNDGTQATQSGGAKTELFEDAFNVLSGYLWVPSPEEAPVIAPGEAYILDLPAAPGAALTMDGSVTFEEVG